MRRTLLLGLLLILGPLAAPAQAASVADPGGVRAAVVDARPAYVAGPATADLVGTRDPVGVLAQVEVDPDSTGMPGAELIQKILNWLSQLALWGSLASILAGAAVYGLAQNAGNYNGAFRGKQMAIAGAVGACLAGLAPTAINLLFNAAGAS